MYELLESRGFRIAKLFPYGAEIRPYTPSMENFTYAHYVALSPAMVEDLA